MIGQGHRRIVFVGDLAYPWVRVRHGAFLKACHEAKLKPITLTTPKPIGFVDYGEWACNRVLARRPRPTAVVAVNDEVAFGGHSAARLVFDINSITVPDSRGRA